MVLVDYIGIFFTCCKLLASYCISEILLKVTLNTIKQNKTNNKHGKTCIFHLHNMIYITLGIFVLQ